MSPPLPPFLRGLRPTLHIAHRGGAALAPENTLDAFRQAVERYRIDMLELDVHLTRDGEVVVAHDDTLERTTNGRGQVPLMKYSVCSHSGSPPSSQKWLLFMETSTVPLPSASLKWNSMRPRER